ncbi:MAG TPA: hypothetical protein VJV96_17980 [Candidatus Angelobacter sp.]|jgi:hypothetical protein|nr:hypothetical protein [Candidatus Angelobacter sp.]
MKRIAILSALALCVAMIAPKASAQDSDTKNHGNFGIYLDYTRLGGIQGTHPNMFGVGGRLGVNVSRHIVMEGEMAYDFERNVTSTTNGITNVNRSSLRLLHGLFGPKIQTTGPVRVFALLKGGFVNFGVGGPATAGTINNQIGNIVDGNTDGVFYPGGGVEFNIGWLGIRAEAGDEIMFLNNGTQNNLRMTIGPQIRF